MFFGPEPRDSCINNKEIESRMPPRSNGKGSYLMDVNFVGGGSTEITVDSGVEQNVCPYNWGSQFGIDPPDRWMNFRNASGGYIDHLGSRRVEVVSTF